MDLDESTDGKPSQPEDPVDCAFEVLVDNAIEEFGLAPRDVYGGVFQLLQTKMRHTDQVNYSKLKHLVGVFSRDLGLDMFSHYVVAVKPHYLTPSQDRWEIHFKSTRIARRVVELMRSKEDDHIRDTYALLHKIPEASYLAAPVFEAIAHRVLSGRYIQPIPMLADNSIPPTFTTDGTPLSPSTPPLDHVKATRLLDLFYELSSVTSSNDQYYIPTPTNNPLFDSFTIDIDADKRTAMISVFSITISPRHGGSSEAYLLIRNIMRHVRKLLELPNFGPRIEVSYFLVCPDDGSQYQWNMPADWNKNTTANDHRGKAYCIRIPPGYLGVRRVYSHQICDLFESWLDKVPPRG